MISELHLIVLLCLIGLLVTLNLMFWFPEMGAMIAQSDLF
jgi:hypothetical protein